MRNIIEESSFAIDTKMAGGISGDPAVFLDGDTRAGPRHALDSLGSLSAASLESLASAAASEMAGSRTHSSNAQTAAEPPGDCGASAAMYAIVAAFARDGGARSSAEQRQQLYALGVEDDDFQVRLISVLASVVPSVERVLANTSFDFAHVVDVNWRLDYVLRSSSSGSIREPLYFVQLKLQSPSASDSELQTVAFSCSVEELRSLVYRIQEAANEVEKLVAGTPSRLRTRA
ncbi:hypothetical protein V7S43_004227 [Phytophthora oleae]|uniref:COMM domain-containing protein 3 n=1 Tax=Phytophthora oleae TaxID=2107226 RepID=A0ABD3G1F6_9STRA